MIFGRGAINCRPGVVVLHDATQTTRQLREKGDLLLSERDQTIVADSAMGATYRQIGAEHDLTPQAIGVIVNKAKQQIDSLELDLFRSVNTGDYPTLLIPYGPDFRLAEAYFEWVKDELAKRDVEFRVFTRRIHGEGVVHQFEPIRDTTQE